MANSSVQQINIELDNLQQELVQFKSTIDYLSNAKQHVENAVESVNQVETSFSAKVEDLKKTYTSFIELNNFIEKLLYKIESIDFPERLTRIESGVIETVNDINKIKAETIEQVQLASKAIVSANFEGRFKDLQVTIDSSNKSNILLASSIEKLKLPEKIDTLENNINKTLVGSIDQLEKNTKQIAKETAKTIQDLNLPIRIEKLDANISGLLVAIQNIQSRLESLERTILSKIKDLSINQTKGLLELQKQNELNTDAANKELDLRFKQQQLYSYITWGLMILGITATLLIKFI